jgi:hypothetical protein
MSSSPLKHMDLFFNIEVRSSTTAKVRGFFHSVVSVLGTWVSPVLGLSRPMDKLVAKCGLCERELRESNISRLGVQNTSPASLMDGSHPLLPLRSRRSRPLEYTGMARRK